MTDAELRTIIESGGPTTKQEWAAELAIATEVRRNSGSCTDEFHLTFRLCVEMQHRLYFDEALRAAIREGVVGWGQLGKVVGEIAAELVQDFLREDAEISRLAAADTRPEKPGDRLVEDVELQEAVFNANDRILSLIEPGQLLQVAIKKIACSRLPKPKRAAFLELLKQIRRGGLGLPKHGLAFTEVDNALAPFQKTDGGKKAA